MKCTVIVCILSGLLMSGCQGSSRTASLKDQGHADGSAKSSGTTLKVGFANFSYFNVPVVRSDSEAHSVAKAETGGHRDAFSAIAIFDDEDDKTCLGRVAAVGVAARELVKTANKRC